MKSGDDFSGVHGALPFSNTCAAVRWRKAVAV